MRPSIVVAAACVAVTGVALTVVDFSAASQLVLSTSNKSSLKASPNPSPTGNTTITWQTTSRSADVRVAEDGQKTETLFAAGSTGTSIARFIVAGHVYRFRLYASRQSHTALASVVVTRSNAISATPNPAPAGTTTVRWQTASPIAVVRVAFDGQTERLFAAGASGTSIARFIVAGHVYRFSLYASSQSRTVLAAVVVRH